MSARFGSARALEHLPGRDKVSAPRRAYRLRRTVALGVAGGLVVLVSVLVIGSFLIDEPLRRYMERSLNSQLQGYTVQLPGLDFHPFGFSLTLRGLTIAQIAHPKPPVAQFPQLHASVHWRALLHARLVADFLFRQPHLHINLPQLQHEAADNVPLKDKGWQQALETIYPLKINLFRIENGDLTYIDNDPNRPLQLRQVNLVAENIRNVRSPERVYPSDVHLDGIIFDSGTLRVDGHANFLAEPFAGVDTDLVLDRVKLGYFKPILARMNLRIAEGVLSADGHVEYTPTVERVRLKNLTVRGVQLDYIHSTQTAEQETARVAKVGRAAEELKQAPAAVVRVDRLHVADSTVGYINESSAPRYRVFLTQGDLVIENLSNQSRDGPASIELKGQFMGSGESLVQASVQPVAQNTDLHLAVMIEETDLRSLNDWLRAFGNFDVVAGQFSLYSELTIKNNDISGYLKPILRDVQVYAAPQDTSKPFLHQVYEALVGGLQTLLQNRHGEVGTKVDISGHVSKPETSTWEVVLGLLKNAFIKAIGHGFEQPSDKATP